MKDESGFTILRKRVEYVFELGWIGDSEGRTWAAELRESHVFPTMESAQAFRDTHPLVKSFDPRLGYRTTYDNGMQQIRYQEVLMEDDE